MHWIALQPAPDAALADPHSAWAWWALQFTPWVARVQDALVLEVSGSERLFGGRAALLRQIFESNQPLALINQGQVATNSIVQRKEGGAREGGGGAVSAAMCAAGMLCSPRLAMQLALGTESWQPSSRPRDALDRPAARAA